MNLLEMKKKSPERGNQIFEAQRRQGRLEDAGDFPKVVLIDTISFCNLKCSMCVHKDMKRKKGIMPWSLFSKIINEIAEVDKSTRVWMVFFGEALLLKNRNPSIFEMISYAKSKGLSEVVLNSNGILLDERASKELISSGLDAIYIGIDAFESETYAKIRVGGDYERVVQNTLGLIRLKRAMNSEKPEVFVQFVVMDINEKEVNDFTQFWNRQGAAVKIRQKVSWAGSVDAPNLILKEQERWPCHWAMQTMSITDTGKVVTCAVDLDARFVAGDISHQSLKEVWNGKLKDIRKLHFSRRFHDLPQNCLECRDWQAARADYYHWDT